MSLSRPPLADSAPFARPTRRALLRGGAVLAASAAADCAGWSAWLVPAHAQTVTPHPPASHTLALHAREIRAALAGSAAPHATLWRFTDPGMASAPHGSGTAGSAHMPPMILRAPLNKPVSLRLTNALPIALGWTIRGLDHTAAYAPNAEPMEHAAPGASRDVILPPLRRGTYLIQSVSGAASEQAARIPLPSAVLIADDIPDAATPMLDAVLMIEDWRLAPNGAPLIPGIHLTGLTLPEALYSANGRTDKGLQLPVAGRLFLRLVNASARAPFALHFAEHDVRVVAIDSAPAEAFMARDSRVILSPGSRMDVEIAPRSASQAGAPVTLFDGTQRVVIAHLEPRGGGAPGPNAAKDADSLHLPKAIGLTGAKRVALAFGAASAGNAAPAGPFAAFDEGASLAGALKSQPSPAFKARRGETISLALTNSASAPTTMQLDGLHFRLLDALDDGWKPFWLDTLTIEAGHTARIAFSPQARGRFPLILRPLDWKAAALVAWFEVT